jgi:nucleoside-diphosphate-sugar epimerase
MPAKVFVTGFPGFLGSELVRRILRRPGRAEVVCLVQPKFAVLSARRAGEIAATEGVDAERITLVEGDITRPHLDLVDAAGVARGVTEIFHLAAIYDLSVPREVGLKVNVTGTRNLLDFAEGAADLVRFQYV